MSFETSGYDYHAVVSSIVTLHRNTGLPEHFKQENPKRTGEEFDVMEYFKVLKHISPPEGQILDYVYWYARGNGRPVLYLRERARPPFRNFKDCEKEDPRKEEENLPTLLKLDGTPESFFELVVFKALSGQFYLAWHAGYNDTRLITLRNEVEEILAGVRVSEEDQKLMQERMRSIEVTPSVKFLDDDTVSVSVVLFSDWQGFFRVTEMISRIYPHILRAMDRQVLMEYDCGICF